MSCSPIFPVQIIRMNNSVGGVMEFLECEENKFLMDFNTRNKFKMFDVRTTVPTHGEEPHQLNQLLKLI